MPGFHVVITVIFSAIQRILTFVTTGSHTFGNGVFLGKGLFKLDSVPCGAVELHSRFWLGQTVGTLWCIAVLFRGVDLLGGRPSIFHLLLHPLLLLLRFLGHCKFMDFWELPPLWEKRGFCFPPRRCLGADHPFGGRGFWRGALFFPFFKRRSENAPENNDGRVK